MELDHCGDSAYHLRVLVGLNFLSVGRFAPQEELQGDLRNLAESVKALAEAEAARTKQVLRVSMATLGTEQPQEQSFVPGQESIPRRLRWSAPPLDSFSEATRNRWEELRQASEDNLDLNRIWRWINGRRTAQEVHQRLRHGGEIPLPVVVEYLQLLAGEGFLDLKGAPPMRGHEQPAARTD